MRNSIRHCEEPVGNHNRHCEEPVGRRGNLLRSPRILRMLAMTIFLLFHTCYAADNILNIYAWSSEIPPDAIHQFEKQTGIKINISTYENNEVMYAKLRATKSAGYDLIMPSSYFVDRMRRQGMLAELDTSKLSNWHNLNPDLLNASYDPGAKFSMPFIWGVTGIFYNKQYQSTITQWKDLWQDKFNDQLLVLDDTREMFSMALMSLGYPANDQNPDHIKQAFQKLQLLMPKIKVFASDAVVSIITDDDATAGMAWNGDVFKAAQDNSNLQFVFPKEGFVIWVDTLAIPVNAEHKDAAYAFLNFLLQPDIAKSVADYTNFPIANLAGQKLLPDAISHNSTIYPTKEILAHGQFQTDLSDATLALYEKYWEQLKMGQD